MQQRGKLKVLAGLAAAVMAAVFLAARYWPSPARPAVDSPTDRLFPKAVPAAKRSATTHQTAADRLFSFRAVDAVTGKGIPRAGILVVSAKDQKQMLTRPETVDVQTNLQTDAEGRCDFRLPYTNPFMLTVAVSADGYEDRRACGDLEHPLPDGYVLKVPRGFTIGGIVQDESGQPVSGAGIGVLFDRAGDSTNLEFLRERFGPPGSGMGIVATTDSAGRWSFGRCSSNRDFRIVGHHPDYLTAVYQEDGDARAIPTEPTLKLDDLRADKAVLVLKSGLTLCGEVTDEHGYRVAGAWVSHAPGSRRVLTESDGSFVLAPLPLGKGVVTIIAAGFAPQGIPVVMGSNTAPLAIQLKPGAVLRLRVLDEAGSPLPEARVELARWQQGNGLQWGGLTDSEGRIAWDSAPLDGIRLTVGKEGYCVLRDQINLVADGQEHVITMGLPLTLVGHVTDAETKQPIASFKVRRDPDVAYGTNGQFELKITQYYHEILVLVEAAGYEPALSNPVDACAAPLTCDVELKPQTQKP